DFLAADERRVDALGREAGRQARGIADEMHAAGEVEARKLDLDRRAFVRRIPRIDTEGRQTPLEVRPDRRRAHLALVPAGADADVILVREDPEIAACEHGRVERDVEIAVVTAGNVVLAREERTRSRQSKRLTHARSGTVRADQMAVSQSLAVVRDGLRV